MPEDQDERAVCALRITSWTFVLVITLGAGAACLLTFGVRMAQENVDTSDMVLAMAIVTSVEIKSHSIYSRCEVYFNYWPLEGEEEAGKCCNTKSCAWSRSNNTQKFCDKYYPTKEITVWYSPDDIHEVYCYKKLNYLSDYGTLMFMGAFLVCVFLIIALCALGRVIMWKYKKSHPSTGTPPVPAPAPTDVGPPPSSV